MTEEPSFWSKTWEKTKTAFSWFGSKAVAPILGPVLALVLIAGAFLLVTMGFKDLQIGGLLAKLLGKKPDPEVEGGKTIELANSVDKDRVNSDGTLIQPGTPDSTGQTQAVVVPIKEPGLFSDPKKVVFTPPGDTKPTTVVLPDGVTNKDVDQVVVVKPDVVVVTVKDNSGVSVKQIDNLLQKYGG